MAVSITPGTSINSGDVVTRQTLQDLVKNASISTVNEIDLSEETVQNVTATNPPTGPGPGTMWWDKSDQVMKVWHDVVEGTGVSLWLAIGPDRFDIEAIAAQPIPFGAAVILDLEAGHKWVKLPPSGSDLVGLGYTAARMEPLKVIGFNNTGPGISPVTAASGAWFSMAIAGVCWAWFPMNRNNGSAWLAGGAAVTDVLTLISGVSFGVGAGGFTSPRGYDLETARGGLIAADFSGMQNDAQAYVCNTVHRTIATDTIEGYSRVLFFCPRMGRNTNA